MISFHWIDTHPGSYWVIGSISCLLWFGWIGYSLHCDGGRRRLRWHGFVTALLIFLVILAWRWPSLFYPAQFSPDESQLIAGAITLEHDPVFWRSVDGNTSGPLNFYALLPLHLLGAPQGYFCARLTGLLLTWGSLWLCCWLLSVEYGASIGLLGLLPALAFYATTLDWDFIDYSSEYVSIFLIMLAAGLLRKAQLGARIASGGAFWHWLSAGFCIGLLPWAKLQSIPMAMVLEAWGAWIALRHQGSGRADRVSALASLTAASLAPSMLILTAIVVLGQWQHFFASYVLGNMIYLGWGSTLTDTVRQMWALCSNTGSFLTFPIGPVCVLTVALGVLLIKKQSPKPVFFLGGLLTAAAILSVMAPRLAYPHYLLFIVLPLTWWGASALGELSSRIGSPTGRLILSVLFILVSLGGTAVARIRFSAPQMVGRLEESWRQPYGEGARILRALGRPDDTVAVWGWDSEIYVQSGLPQAAREGPSTRELYASPLRDSYYRPRYMADLARSRPAFFYDAVGPGSFFFSDREADGHETFPALRRYVQSHFVLYRDFGFARLYVSPDRMAVRNH